MKVIWKIGPPRTCWWTPNAKTGARIDYLFSITRVYSRKYRGYFYQFNLGGCGFPCASPADAHSTRLEGR